jgi:hypothetical protein
MKWTLLSSACSLTALIAVPSAAQERASMKLAGSVVVIDGAGVAHPEVSGSIRWLTDRVRTHPSLSSPVENGRFRVELPEQAMLMPVELVLDGRPAMLDAPIGNLRVPTDEPVTLFAHWPEDTRLHVLDLETRAELEDVTVALGSTSGRRPLLPDAWSKMVFASAASPIELPRAQEYESEYRVSSPGHAWARAVLLRSDSGAREVLLAPAGDLEVELTGAPTPPRAQLWVRRGAKDFVADEQLDARRSVRLERMPVGQHELEVILRSNGPNPVVLGRTTVTVKRGEVARAVLDLAPRPEPRSASLSGVVIVPAGWRISGFQLQCKLQDGPHFTRTLDSDAMQRDTEHPERYLWHFADVPAGRYALTIQRPWTSQEVVVEPPGRDDVVLQLAQPVDLQVRVVDAASGEPVGINDLMYWFRSGPPPEFPLSDDTARLDEHRNVYLLQAPVGWMLDLKILDESYRGQLDGQLVREGAKELVLRAHRPNRLQLKLACAGRAVAWDQNARVTAHLEGKDEEQVLQHFGAYPPLLEVDDPGTWIVNVPEIPGYEPLPPQKVELRAGEDGLHFFQLTPRR